jgi:hypothetical protein
MVKKKRKLGKIIDWAIGIMLVLLFLGFIGWAIGGGEEQTTTTTIKACGDECSRRLQ